MGIENPTILDILAALGFARLDFSVLPADKQESDFDTIHEILHPNILRRLGEDYRDHPQEVKSRIERKFRNSLCDIHVVWAFGNDIRTKPRQINDVDILVTDDKNDMVKKKAKLAKALDWNKNVRILSSKKAVDLIYKITKRGA